ncbi:thiamine diphosphokinase [Chloroflexota bacterium]
MKALILTNGELYRPDVLLDRISGEVFAIVLGVDGGARHARTLNVTLNTIIGDLDSLSEPDQHGFNDVSVVAWPAEKNETDLELALFYAAKQGVDQIVMVGVMGGRMDMTIANIQLLTHAGLDSCKVEVWHGEQTAWVIRPPGGDVSGHPGDTVSLIPISGDASGITTHGLKYQLNDEKLRFGPTRGVSNLMETSSGLVVLSKGRLLVVHTPRRQVRKEEA